MINTKAALEAEIQMALHHLQSDGPIARGSIAGTLRDCLGAIQAEPSDPLTPAVDAAAMRERETGISVP